IATWLPATWHVVPIERIGQPDAAVPALQQLACQGKAAWIIHGQIGAGVESLQLCLLPRSGILRFGGSVLRPCRETRVGVRVVKGIQVPRKESGRNIAAVWIRVHRTAGGSRGRSTTVTNHTRLRNRLLAAMIQVDTRDALEDTTAGIRGKYIKLGEALVTRTR